LDLYLKIDVQIEKHQKFEVVIKHNVNGITIFFLCMY
jgi:hypothetical protein